MTPMPVSFGTALRERLYLSPLRVLLRRVGIGRALALVSGARSLGYHVRFCLRPRRTIVVRVRGLSARFPISSSLEMRLIETLGGEKKLLRCLVREARAGDVAYDIGTNIGLYTVFLTKAVGESGRVVGFEPELRSYRRCMENLHINALKNVQLFDRALGNEEKETDLVIAEQPEFGVHHLLRSKGDSAASRLQPVRVVIGDRFVAEQALPIPNILKIDVEGMELEVLLGLAQTLRLPECRLVCCEVHFAILDHMDRKDVPRKILELLEASEFKRVVWVDSSHFLAFKDLPRQRG